MELKFECPTCGQHISATPAQIGVTAPLPKLQHCGHGSKRFYVIATTPAFAACRRRETSSATESTLSHLWSGCAQHAQDISHERSCRCDRIHPPHSVRSWDALWHFHALYYWRCEHADLRVGRAQNSGALSGAGRTRAHYRRSYR